MAKKIVILSAAAKRNNCHPEAEDSVACDRVPTKDLCTSATKPSVEHAVVGVGTNAPTTAVDFAFARVRTDAHARESFRVRTRLQSCHSDRTRIYGMAESYPLTLKIVISSEVERPASLGFRTAHPPHGRNPTPPLHNFRCLPQKNANLHSFCTIKGAIHLSSWVPLRRLTK